MGHFDPHVASQRLGVVEDLSQRVDRATGNAGGLHDRQQVRLGALRDDRADQRDELVAVAQPLRVRGEARIGREMLGGQDSAQPFGTGRRCRTR